MKFVNLLLVALVSADEVSDCKSAVLASTDQSRDVCQALCDFYFERPSCERTASLIECIESFHPNVCFLKDASEADAKATLFIPHARDVEADESDPVSSSDAFEAYGASTVEDVADQEKTAEAENSSNAGEAGMRHHKKRHHCHNGSECHADAEVDSHTDIVVRDVVSEHRLRRERPGDSSNDDASVDFGTGLMLDEVPQEAEEGPGSFSDVSEEVTTARASRRTERSRVAVSGEDEELRTSKHRRSPKAAIKESEQTAAREEVPRAEEGCDHCNDGRVEYLEVTISDGTESVRTTAPEASPTPYADEAPTVAATEPAAGFLGWLF